jgi:hypothetical protein
MSEDSKDSLLELLYPSGGNISVPMLPIPQSPIDYEAAEQRLREQAKRDEYNNAYMLSYGTDAQIEVPEVSADDNMLDNLMEYAVGENRAAEHPGPPWFH